MSGKPCAVAGCKNNDKSPNISFHRFPHDKNLRKIWILKCQRKDPFNPDSARICSAHFYPDELERDFRAELMGSRRKRNLKPNVIPSLNLKSSVVNTLDEAMEKRMLDKIKKEEHNHLVESAIGLASPSSEVKVEIPQVKCELEEDFGVELMGACRRGELEPNVIPSIDFKKIFAKEVDNRLDESPLGMSFLSSEVKVEISEVKCEIDPINYEELCDQLVTEKNELQMKLNSKTQEAITLQLKLQKAEIEKEIKNELQTKLNSKTQEAIALQQKLQKSEMEKEIEKEIKNELLKKLNSKIEEATTLQQKLQAAEMEKETEKEIKNELQKKLNSKTQEAIELQQKLQAAKFEKEKTLLLLQTKQCEKDEVSSILTKLFSPNEIKLLKEKQKKVHWTIDEITNAFILRNLNKRAYIYLKEKRGFPLPGISTLKRWAAHYKLLSSSDPSKRMITDIKLKGEKKQIT